jgi:hypothetical protein
MDQEKGQMHAQRKDERRDATPAILAIVATVLGVAGTLFEDFGPGNGSRGSGNASMNTAAAVFRAGAIEILSEPPTGRSAS